MQGREELAGKAKLGPSRKLLGASAAVQQALQRGRVSRERTIFPLGGRLHSF